MTEEPGLARARRKQAGEHFHGGGLAATVRAEETENLATLDAEADAIDGREVAKPHRQVASLDGDLSVSTTHDWRNNDGLVTSLLFFRQQGDEGSFERVRTGLSAQLEWSSDRQDTTRIHCHQPVEVIGFFHISCCHNNAHFGTVAANPRDQIPELAARQRINARS